MLKRHDPVVFFRWNLKNGGMIMGVNRKKAVLNFIEVIKKISGDNYILYRYGDNCYNLYIKTDIGRLREGKYGITIGLTMKEMHCYLMGLIKGLGIE